MQVDGEGQQEAKFEVFVNEKLVHSCKTGDEFPPSAEDVEKVAEEVRRQLKVVE